MKKFKFYVYIDKSIHSLVNGRISTTDYKMIEFKGDLQSCISKFNELYIEMKHNYLSLGIEYGVDDVDIFYDGVTGLTFSKMYKQYESIDASIVEYAIDVLKKEFNIKGE